MQVIRNLLATATRQGLLWLMLLAIAPVLMLGPFLWVPEVRWHEWQYGTLSCIACVLMIFTLLHSFKMRRLLQIVSVASVLLAYWLWLGIRFFAEHYLHASDVHLPSIMFPIYDSNVAESREFLASQLQQTPQFFMLGALGCVLGLAAGTIVPGVVASRLNLTRPRSIGLIIVLALLFNSTIHGNGHLLNPFRGPYATFQQYHSELNKIAKASQLTPAAQAELANVGLSQRQQMTLVLVIGESTTRHNMSLYGYERPTTPLLDSLRAGPHPNSSPLYVFNDVISPNAHTIPVLRKLFSFTEGDAGNQSLESLPGLLHVVRQGGFKSFWISSQQVLGTFDSLTTAVAQSADQKIFANPGRWASNAVYDDAVLPHFDNALRDPAPRKLIIVHLLGTHIDYVNRYPATYNLFGNADDNVTKQLSAAARRPEIVQARNHYDNAVRFHDFVLSEIIKRLQHAVSAPYAMLYLADHGDDVGHSSNYFGHSEQMLHSVAFEIPMLLLTSLDIAHELPQQSDLENRPYQAHRLIHTVLDLMQIPAPFMRPEDSLVNPHFTPIPRVVNGINYDTARGDLRIPFHLGSPRSAGNRVFPERVWVHRTNTVEKFNYLSSSHNAFEMDLMFNTETHDFDVGHSRTELAGITLSRYFATANNVHNKYFWFDIKNISESNIDDLLATLEKFSVQYQLKNRLIVESQMIHLLPRFVERGYYCSYYLPQLESYPNEDAWREFIRAQLQSYRVNAISTTVKNYRKLTGHFLNHDALLWFLPKHPETMFDDTRVKVFIKGVKTPYDI